MLDAVVKADDVDFESSGVDEFFVVTDELDKKKFKNRLMTLLYRKLTTF